MRIISSKEQGVVPTNLANGRLHRLKGVALVLVLSFLVVISGLIIAFFSMVTTEASSAGTTAAASSAKTLADSAVSLVMGTIVEATQGRDPVNDANGGPQFAWAWTSQPGMIRNFDNTGKLRYVYKLYSADDMKIANALPTSTDTANLTGWAQGGNKEVWVDMNEPIKDLTGEDDIYPIVDPRAAEDYSATGYPGREEVSTGDRQNSNMHKVAGFSIDRTDTNMPSRDPNNNNPAPMPVKWLYVLQNGKMATARVDGKDAALNGSDVSDTNPIKGRIAFWTDDESSKVNINTASHGTYWDVPRVYSNEDGGALASATISAAGPQPAPGGAGMALTQPNKGEYQRYPGHPATTSLGEIFGYRGKNGFLSPVLPLPESRAGVFYSVNDAAQIEKYYTLTPRINTGGSLSGTKIPTAAMPLPDYGGFWRLYASTEELLFDAIDPEKTQPRGGGGPAGNGDTIHRVPNVLPTASSNNPDATIRGAITPEMMQKAKFFITANSSAPELTMFNTPRISMWPVNDTTKFAWYSTPEYGFPAPFRFKNTAFDNTAKFCATVGPLPKENDVIRPATNIYYFTRFNSRSHREDFEGGRNETLYRYLQKLTSLQIPGVAGGGTFAQKYGGTGATGVSNRDQLLTCIYDYIRCTNMQDSTIDPLPDPSNPVQFPFRYTPISVVTGGGGTNKPNPGAGEVIPIRIPTERNGSKTTNGFGRVDTIGSAYLLFFSAHAYPYDTQITASGQSFYTPRPNPGLINNPEVGTASYGPTDAMGIVFMISFNSVMQGNVGNHPLSAFSVENLDKLFFTAGPYTDANGVGPNTDGHVFAGASGGSAAGAVQVTSDLHPVTNKTPVFYPGRHVNLIENSDVRTWHGRGIGGTCSPVIAFTNGLWGAGDKNCKSNTRFERGNYPFFAYTDQIAKDTKNLTKAATNVYYPVTFKINQVQGLENDIIVRFVPSDKVGSNGGFDPADAYQIVNLRFPPAVLHMPWTRPGDAGSTDYPIGDRILYTKTQRPFFFSNRLPGAGGGADTGGSADFISGWDTIVSLEPAGINSNGATTLGDAAATDHTAGDQRMYAALREVPSTYFQPNLYYGAGKNEYGNANAPQMAHNMMRSVGGVNVGFYRGVIAASGPSKGQANVGKLINTNNPYSRYPDVPRRVFSDPRQGSGGYVTRADGGQASWDTGMAMHKDGAYVNKPDEGDQNYFREDTNPRQYRVPYVYKEDYFANVGSFFSPNRQIPSSMMLGSIPTSIQTNRPWQTLLFHPPGAGDAGHPGSQSPADHYMADLFWMPTVEPYAISQPFSTAGKINMNYQIQPFTYIKRKTAMRAVMASTKMAAILSTLTVNYKPEFGEDLSNQRLTGVRFPINLDVTMNMLDYKFDVQRDVYRSATEIATIPLVPKDPAITTSGTEDLPAMNTRLDAYWRSGSSITLGRQLTGNNLRNKPYADIYGRLTTKSNSFTVHVRAQALRKATSTPATKWVFGKDQVVGEYRGSSIIERYIDANDPLLPDFASAIVGNGTGTNLNMEQYYKFRVVSTKRFTP